MHVSPNLSMRMAACFKRKQKKEERQKDRKKERKKERNPSFFLPFKGELYLQIKCKSSLQ